LKEKVSSQELRTLGKGGYGLVVAAVNRLDGRQYAIKKIKMPSSAPAAYSRLMREVATLARLQHPYIVRYFQVSHQLLSLACMLQF
jgi:translation initiation factor 2-alpha kinase 4